MTGPPFGVLDREGVVHVLRRAHKAYAAHEREPSDETYQAALDAGEAYRRAVENYTTNRSRLPAEPRPDLVVDDRGKLLSSAHDRIPTAPPIVVRGSRPAPSAPPAPRTDMGDALARLAKPMPMGTDASGEALPDFIQLGRAERQPTQRSAQVPLPIRTTADLPAAEASATPARPLPVRRRLTVGQAPPQSVLDQRITYEEAQRAAGHEPAAPSAGGPLADTVSRALRNEVRAIERALGRDAAVRFLAQGTMKVADAAGERLGFEADPRLRRVVDLANRQRQAEVAGRPDVAAELTRGLTELAAELQLIPGALTPSRTALAGPRIWATLEGGEAGPAIAPALKALRRAPGRITGVITEGLPGTPASRIARGATEEAARLGYVESPVAAAQERDPEAAAARARGAAVAGALFGGVPRAAGELFSANLERAALGAARRNLPVPEVATPPRPLGLPGGRVAPEAAGPEPITPEPVVSPPPEGPVRPGAAGRPVPEAEVEPPVPAVPAVRGIPEVEADIRRAVNLRDEAAVSGDVTGVAAIQTEIAQLAAERAQMGLAGAGPAAAPVPEPAKPGRALHDAEGQPIPGTETLPRVGAGEPLRPPKAEAAPGVAPGRAEGATGRTAPAPAEPQPTPPQGAIEERELAGVAERVGPYEIGPGPELPSMGTVRGVTPVLDLGADPETRATRRLMAEHAVPPGPATKRPGFGVYMRFTPRGQWYLQLLEPDGRRAHALADKWQREQRASGVKFSGAETRVVGFEDLPSGNVGEVFNAVRDPGPAVERPTTPVTPIRGGVAEPGATYEEAPTQRPPNADYLEWSIPRRWLQYVAEADDPRVYDLRVVGKDPDPMRVRVRIKRSGLIDLYNSRSDPAPHVRQRLATALRETTGVAEPGASYGTPRAEAVSLTAHVLAKNFRSLVERYGADKVAPITRRSIEDAVSGTPEGHTPSTLFVRAFGEAGGTSRQFKSFVQDVVVRLQQVYPDVQLDLKGPESGVREEAAPYGAPVQPRHTWVKEPDEFGRTIEVSNTPYGRYAVIGHGAGRMRWSTEFPPNRWGNPDAALAETKYEARHNAELHLADRIRRGEKPTGVAEAGQPYGAPSHPTIVPMEAASTWAGGWTPLTRPPTPGSVEHLTRAVRKALTGPDGEDLVQVALFGREIAQRMDGYGLYTPTGATQASLTPNTIHIFPEGTPTEDIELLADAHGLLENQNEQMWLRDAAPDDPDLVVGYNLTLRDGSAVTRAQLEALRDVLNSDERFVPIRGATLWKGEAVFANFGQDPQYLSLLREALDLAQIDVWIDEHNYAGALRGHSGYTQSLEGRDPALLGRLAPHLDAVQSAYEGFGQSNGIQPANTKARFDAVREALGLDAPPDALARFPLDFDTAKMRAAIRRADGSWVTGRNHDAAREKLTPDERYTTYEPHRDDGYEIPATATTPAMFATRLEGQSLLARRYAAFSAGPGLTSEELRQVQRELGRQPPPTTPPETPPETGPTGVAEEAAPYGGTTGPSPLDIGSGNFYSRVLRAAETAKLTKATGSEWDTYLSKQPMLRDEYEYTLQPWLREHAGEKLTKDQVVAAARERQVRLKETVLGTDTVKAEPAFRAAEEAASLADDEMGKFLSLGARIARLEPEMTRHLSIDEVADQLSLHGVSFTEVNNPGLAELFDKHKDLLDAAYALDRAFQRSRDLNVRAGAGVGAEPRYAGYVEPGGKNYREIVVQLDRPGTHLTPAPVHDLAGGGYGVEGPDGALEEFSDRSAAESFARSQARRALRRAGKEVPAPFRSPHWEGIENPLLHVRLDDRVGPNGEKTLFVEEVQSDWHQKGRTAGYRGDRAPLPWVEGAIKGSGERQWKVPEGAPGTEILDPADRPTITELMWGGKPAYRYRGINYASLEEAKTKAERFVNEGQVGEVPDAPFKKTEDWLGLAWRRIVDEAVAGGYDRIAWTTGDQQAARYDLSRLVRRVYFANPVEDETGKIIRGDLVVTDVNGLDVISEKDASMERVAELIGKDAARRLATEPTRREGTTHVLSGEGLRVGGQGMKAFYDQILPNVIRAWAKKRGMPVHVEPTALSEGIRYSVLRVPGDRSAYQVLENGKESGFVGTKAEAEAEVARLRAEGQDVLAAPSIRVTPELATAVRTKGQEVAEPAAPYGEPTKPKAESQPLGLPAWMRTRAPTSIALPRRGSPLAGDSYVPEAIRAVGAELDRLAQQYPQPLRAAATWARAMHQVFRDPTGQVPRAPAHAIALAQPISGVRRVLADLAPMHGKKATPMGAEQRAAGARGLEKAVEIRRILEGRHPDVARDPVAVQRAVASVLLQVRLSPKAGAYLSDSALLEMIGHTGSGGKGLWSFLDDVSAGRFDLDEYGAWVDELYPIGKKTGLVGPQVSGNARGFGDVLVALQQQHGGERGLDAVVRVFSSTMMTGPEMRRHLLGYLGAGTGLDTKTISFALLLSGKLDVLVFDRIQSRLQWAGGKGLEGDPYEGGNLVNVLKGGKGLAVYEAVERGVRGNVRKAYAQLGISGDIGRYHWESWVVQGGQVVEHEPLAGHLGMLRGEEKPYAGISVGQWNVEKWQHGIRYEPGSPKPFQVPMWDGRVLRFTRPQAEAIFEGWKTLGGKQGITTVGGSDVPWFERFAEGRAQRDEVARRLAEAFDRGAAPDLKVARDVGRDVAAGRGPQVPAPDERGAAPAAGRRDEPAVTGGPPEGAGVAEGKAPYGVAPAEAPLLPLPQRTVEDDVAALRAAGNTKAADNLEKFMRGSVVRSVLFHGTTDAPDFAAFKRRPGDVGIHFGNAGQAEDRIDYRLASGGSRIASDFSGPRTFPVYVRITNPLRLEDAGLWNGDNLGSQLARLFPPPKSEGIVGPRAWQRVFERMTPTQIRRFLQSKGYDGIVYRNTGETAGGEEVHQELLNARLELPENAALWDDAVRASPEYRRWDAAFNASRTFRETHAEDSYIAFEPTQIKSAIGNQGTFSPKDRSLVREPSPAEAAQMELVFGSPEVAAQATRLAADANRVPTLDERRQVIPTGKKTWVDVQGKRLANAQDAALVGRVFRSPTTETLEYLLLDDQGTILAREAVTSGAIDMVALNVVRDAVALARRAERVGATRVVVMHNHPSGNPAASRNDIGMTMALRDALREPRIGVPLTVEHFIIDHDTLTVIDFQVDGTPFTSVVKITPPAEGPLPDWSQVRGPRLASPADVVKAAGPVPENELHVYYRDSLGRAVAMVPHRASAAETIGTWLAQEARAVGGVDAIVVVPSGNVTLWRRLVHGAPGEVMDVIGVETTGKGYGTYESAREHGALAERRPDAGPARRARHLVGEEPASYEPAGGPGRGEGAVPESGAGPERPAAEGATPPAERYTVADITELPEDYQVHLETITADPKGSRVLAARVKFLRESGKLPEKPVVTFLEAAEAAKDVDLTRELKRSGALTGPAGIAIKEAFDVNDRFLKAAYRRLGTLAQGTHAWEQQQRDIAKMETFQNALLARYIPGASADGRNLVMLKYNATKTWEPFFWYQQAQKMKGLGSPLTTEEMQKINGFIDAGDRSGMVTYINTMKPPLTWRDPLWWTTIRKAMMLSGRAFFRNFVGNTSRAFFEMGARWPARGMDLAMSGITGRRQLAIPDAHILEQMTEGLAEGFGKMRAAMRGQWTEAEEAKIESAQHGRRLEPKGVNAVVQFFFNLQIAGDRPTYWAAYRRAIAEFAKLQAAREGLKGKAAMERRVALENDTPAEVAIIAVHEALRARAHSEAKEASYQNRGYLAHMATGARTALREGFTWGKVTIPPLPLPEAGFDFTLPFTQTPSSVTGYNVSALPIAALRTPIDLYRLFVRARRGKDPDPEMIDALQRQSAKYFGRWVFGLLPVVLAYYAYKDGLLTGPAKKGGIANTRRLAGWKPFAVKVGNQYVPLWQFGPIGATAAFGATLAWAGEKENTNLLEATPDALQQVANTIMETPFLRGFKDVNSFLQNVPGGGSALARSWATSFVPTGIGGTARTSDTIERRRGTIWEAVRGRIPGLRQTVEPEVSPLSGEAVPTEPNTLARALKEMVEPLGISRNRAADDPVLATLLRYNVGITTPKQLEGESPTTYTARQRSVGRALREELAADPVYLEAARSHGTDQAAEDLGEDLQNAVRRIQRRLLREATPDTATTRARPVRRRATRRTR